MIKETKDSCTFLTQNPPLDFNIFSRKILAKPLVRVETRTLVIPTAKFIWLVATFEV
jgi:hypothetical protein